MDKKVIIERLSNCLDLLNHAQASLIFNRETDSFSVPNDEDLLVVYYSLHSLLEYVDSKIESLD